MKKLMFVREHEIEKHLYDLCKERNWWAAKWKPTSKRGVPDRMVLRDRGRITFIELKVPDEEPEAHQLRRHAELRALGFEVVVLDSKEAVEAWVANA